MELDRAKVIHENFSDYIKQQNFPKAKPKISLHHLNREAFLDLFETQLIARHIDLQARAMKEKGLGFYTIGSAGHEGNAAIAHCFRHTDMAFLHYRSSAFMIQRSKQLTGIDAIREQLLSLAASKLDPISSGRHKVFGSVPLYVPPQTSTIASHLPKAVGCAYSITQSKMLEMETRLPHDSVVLCSFGDASFNHSTAQGAINAAQWISYQHYPLPIVFICEDNGIGISVPTPENWVKNNAMHRPGIYYIEVNGLDLDDVIRGASEAAYYARTQRKPVFLHMHCVRLMGHAGSDIESQYWTEHQIIANEFQDPLLHSARILLEIGYLNIEEILNLYRNVETRVKKVTEEVMTAPKLTSAEEIMDSIIPPKKKLSYLKFLMKQCVNLFLLINMRH